MDTQYEPDLFAIDKMINTTQFVKHINFSFIAFNPKTIHPFRFLLQDLDIEINQEKSRILPIITSYFLNEIFLVVNQTHNILYI